MFILQVLFFFFLFFWVKQCDNNPAGLGLKLLTKEWYTRTHKIINSAANSRKCLQKCRQECWNYETGKWRCAETGKVKGWKLHCSLPSPVLFLSHQISRLSLFLLECLKSLKFKLTCYREKWCSFMQIKQFVKENFKRDMFIYNWCLNIRKNQNDWILSKSKVMVFFWRHCSLLDMFIEIFISVFQLIFIDSH